MVFLACGYEFYEIAFSDCAVLYLEICYDASEWVENRVEDKGLQRGFGVAHGSRNSLDDSL